MLVVMIGVRETVAATLKKLNPYPEPRKAIQFICGQMGVRRVNRGSKSILYQMN
jgi:hypothetical protein